MDIREATDDDVEEIRRVARASLLASYAPKLDEDLVEEAVERWYGERLADDLASDDAVVLVGAEDGEVVAFSQSYIRGRPATIAEINWLHVDPDARGEGIGSRLLERTEYRLLEKGAAQLQGAVLEVNESGREFYAERGYEPGDRREVEVGEETFREHVLVKASAKGVETEAGSVPLDPHSLDDGRTVYVAYDESDRGDEGPLYVGYLDEDRSKKYGYFCGACDGFDVGMDAMGRVECTDCGNARKPSRWDGAYL